MTIREQLEQRERDILAPAAAKSADSRGRLRAEEEDPIRPAFQRDRDRVIHCKAFRRLKHKTQVFFAPTGCGACRPLLVQPSTPRIDSTSAGRESLPPSASACWTKSRVADHEKSPK